MNEESRSQRRYVAYLLRLWAVPGGKGDTIWHASLEAPLTHERHNFAGLESLFAYLQTATETGQPPASLDATKSDSHVSQGDTQVENA